jgi:dihydrofolate reductase
MLSLIVAMSENRVIGRDGGLPWRLSADLKRFKQLTMGHHLLMGRKTFESIGRLLPGRISVVITRLADYQAAGAVVAHSLEAARKLAADDPEVFIIGGGEIYRQALPQVDRIYLTRIHAQVEGDTYFPEIVDQEWTLREDTCYPRDARNEHEHGFLIYDRVNHV